MIPQTGRDGHATETRRLRVEPTSFSQAPRGVVVGIVLAVLILIGVTVNGGNSYDCPGDATDLSLCERVSK